jgi:hypothetical protein
MSVNINDGFVLNPTISIDTAGAIVCGDDIAVVGDENGNFESINIANPASLGYSSLSESNVIAIAGAYLPPSSFFFFGDFSSVLYDPVTGSRDSLPTDSDGIKLKCTSMSGVLIFSCSSGGYFKQSTIPETLYVQ